MSQKNTGRKPNPRSLANLRKGGGRPKGSPNKATAEIKDAARKLVENPAYQASLRQRLEEGKAPHMETLLFHYAYGKPKETVEHQGIPTPPAVQFVIQKQDGAECRP